MLVQLLPMFLLQTTDSLYMIGQRTFQPSQFCGSLTQYYLVFLLHADVGIHLVCQSLLQLPQLYGSICQFLVCRFQFPYLCLLFLPMSEPHFLEYVHRCGRYCNYHDHQPYSPPCQCMVLLGHLSHLHPVGNGRNLCCLAPHGNVAVVLAIQIMIMES